MAVTSKTLSNTQYDWAKRLVQVILPATGSAYFALGNIYDLPNTENVVGTLAIVATFLGTVLGISHSNYRAQGAGHSGDALVTVDGGGMRTVSLEMDGDPEDIINKDVISFRVKRTDIVEEDPSA